MITFHPKQSAAFFFKTQFGVAVAGVQSGKTFLGVYWSLKKIMDFPKENGIIVAPTYKILQQATMKKFFDIAPTYRQFYKEQKGEINLPSGATIFVRSADNPLGIEGITAHWIWLDEGGQCSVLTWTILRSRVSLTKGQILITTTPYNMNWLYTDFYLPWKEKRDKSFSFFTWQSIDNPHFPKEFYEQEQKRLRQEEFARRYMGEFRKMTGLIWDLSDELIINSLDSNIKTEMRVIGVDWGFKNPAAIIVAYLRDNVWTIMDEWKQSEKTTAEIIQVIQNKLKEHKVNKVYCDPAEPDRIEECRRANLPVYEASNDVSGGLSHIAQLIREKRFYVSNKCQEILSEMSMYQFEEQKDTTKPFSDKPVKFNDHLCDAIRYAIYSYQPIKFVFPVATEPMKYYYPELKI